MWRGGGVELARGLTVRPTLSCVRLAIIVVASAVTPKTRGAALFRNIRTRRTPLCTLIFDIRVLETSCACQKRQWKCASTASTNEPTPHALAPLRPARHPANMLMPIWFVVVTWRRCRASARTYAQRMDRRMRWSEVEMRATEVPSAALQFERQRHLQIHPLRDFVFVVAAGAVVVGTRLQTPPHALALGLRRLRQPRAARPSCTSHLRSASRPTHRSFAAGSGSSAR